MEFAITTLCKMQVVVDRGLLYLFIVCFLGTGTGDAMTNTRQCLIGSDCLNFQLNERKIKSVVHM